MPFPVAAAIMAGATLAGGIYNASSTGKTNYKSKKWSDEAYDRQRKDALADVAFQNEYNSPAAQMQRLKAAGLNPNLVYGDGATTQSATIRGSSSEGARINAPQIDTSGAANTILHGYDMQQKEAQIDVLKKSLEVSSQDILLKAAQTANTITGTQSQEVKTELDKFNLSVLKKLENTTLEGAAATVEKIKADTKFTLESNERQAALSQSTLNKAVEEVLNLRATRATTDAQRQQIQGQIKNLEREGILKDLDIQLKKHGIQPHDPMYQRTIKGILDNLPVWDKAGDIEKWNKFKNWVKGIFK